MTLVHMHFFLCLCVHSLCRQLTVCLSGHLAARHTVVVLGCWVNSAYPVAVVLVPLTHQWAWCVCCSSAVLHSSLSLCLSPSVCPNAVLVLMLRQYTLTETVLPLNWLFICLTRQPSRALCFPCTGSAARAGISLASDVHSGSLGGPHRAISSFIILITIAISVIKRRKAQK